MAFRRELQRGCGCVKAETRKLNDASADKCRRRRRRASERVSVVARVFVARTKFNNRSRGGCCRYTAHTSSLAAGLHVVMLCERQRPSRAKTKMDSRATLRFMPIVVVVVVGVIDVER